MSYENRIEELEQEIKDLKTKRQEVETEYSTLKRTVQNKEEEGRKRLSIMEVSLSSLHPSRASWRVRDMSDPSRISLSSVTSLG